jgi:hypothetical protein
VRPIGSSPVLAIQSAAAKADVRELWIPEDRLFDVSLEPAPGGALVCFFGCFHESSTGEEAPTLRRIGPLPLPEATSLQAGLRDVAGLPRLVETVDADALRANPSQYSGRFVRVSARWEMALERSTFADAWLRPSVPWAEAAVRAREHSGSWTVVGYFRSSDRGPMRSFGHFGMAATELLALTMQPCAAISDEGVQAASAAPAEGAAHWAALLATANHDARRALSGAERLANERGHALVTTTHLALVLTDPFGSDGIDTPAAEAASRVLEGSARLAAGARPSVSAALLQVLRDAVRAAEGRSVTPRDLLERLSRDPFDPCAGVLAALGAEQREALLAPEPPPAHMGDPAFIEQRSFVLGWWHATDLDEAIDLLSDGFAKVRAGPELPDIEIGQATRALEGRGVGEADIRRHQIGIAAHRANELLEKKGIAPRLRAFAARDLDRDEPVWLLVTEDERAALVGALGEPTGIEAQYDRAPSDPARDLAAILASAPAERSSARPIPKNPALAVAFAQTELAEGRFGSALAAAELGVADRSHGILAELVRIQALRSLGRRDDAVKAWTATAESWLAGERKVWNTQWASLAKLHAKMKLPDGAVIAEIRKRARG